MPKSTAFERGEMWLKHSEKALFLFLSLSLSTKRRMGQKRQKALTMR